MPSVPVVSHHQVLRAWLFVLLVLLCGLSLAAAHLFIVRPVVAAPPAALYDCDSTITVGMTMACQMSAAAEVDSFTLAATSGEVYLVRVATTAGTLRPQVRMLAPSGLQVCQAANA